MYSIISLISFYYFTLFTSYPPDQAVQTYLSFVGRFYLDALIVIYPFSSYNFLKTSHFCCISYIITKRYVFSCFSYQGLLIKHLNPH